MALTLSTSAPDQSALNRPNDPRDSNGIAHATNTVTPANTKADRATTKLAYAAWLATWKTNSSGDASYEEEFTEAGSGITYADD